MKFDQMILKHANKKRSIPVFLVVEANKQNKNELDNAMQVLLTELKRAESDTTSVRLCVIVFGVGFVALHTPLTEVSRLKTLKPVRDEFDEMNTDQTLQLASALWLTKAMVEDKTLVGRAVVNGAAYRCNEPRDEKAVVVFVTSSSKNFREAECWKADLLDDESYWSYNESDAEFALEAFLGSGRTAASERFGACFGHFGASGLVRSFCGVDEENVCVLKEGELAEWFRSVAKSVASRVDKICVSNKLDVDEADESGGGFGGGFSSGFSGEKNANLDELNLDDLF